MKDARELAKDYSERMDNLLLLVTGTLTDWERGFLKSIQKRYELSPKQQALFEKIKGKYIKEPK